MTFLNHQINRLSSNTYIATFPENANSNLRTSQFQQQNRSYATVTMSTTTITGLFPRFDNGDVKIILSDKPADTLLLHTSVLTKESSFFKASLENVGWAQNKYVWVVDGKKMSHPIKVLKLDFDGDDTFPLLLGTVSLSV